MLFDIAKKYPKVGSIGAFFRKNDKNPEFGVVETPESIALIGKGLTVYIKDFEKWFDLTNLTAVIDNANETPVKTTPITQPVSSVAQTDLTQKAMDMLTSLKEELKQEILPSKLKHDLRVKVETLETLLGL